MLKEERLESRLAQFLYLMTKPEDVTRRQVDRLFNFSVRFRRPQKHITALLSLFKSYKPEVVPEKIQAINIQSIWRPILEPIRKGFEEAKCRVISSQAEENDELSGWNILKIPKRKKTRNLWYLLLGILILVQICSEIKLRNQFLTFPICQV